ncbi:hypothetical protein FOCC_FOCC017918 [Frankliniella occidentalis]|nr:hypothetical protein FOCC_FOCC017918 [Frankliniella occidentalis]
MSDDYPRFDLAHPELLEAFIRDLKLHFDAKGVITDTQKRGILYKAICVETRRYLGEWLHPSTIERETFAAIVEALQGNIKPTINQGVLFNEFVCRFQKEGESGGQYAAALRSMVEGLALGWHADRIALFQLKRGLRDSSLQRRLYREQECTLQEAKIIVNSSEVSKRCIQFVNTLTAEVHAVNFNNKPRDNGGRGSGGGKKKPNATGNLTCFRCGEAGHSVRRCGLGYNKCKCAGCGKVGHLEKACRSKKSNNSALTNYLSAQPPQSSQPSTSNVVVPPACRPFNPFAELFQIQSHQMYDPEDDPVYLTLLVNGRPITMQFDDGAQKTVIAEATFRQHFGTAMDTKMSPVELFAWGCDTPHATGSMVEVSVTFGGKTFKLPLLISPVDPKRSPTLLGRNWIRAFWGRNFLREALQIEKYSINAVEVQAARVVAPPRPQQLSPVNIGAWASKFPCATGTGTGRYNGPPVHLHLKPGSKPKYQPARSIPFPLTTKYNEAVDRNISASVWIPTEVSAWASGLVPVQKRNGELRLCADYKSTLNPALHNDSYCSPTVSEVLAAASGAKIFGELDCKEAYLQIPVDEESSMLMVVNSKRGLFRPTTLQFGVKTAPAIFQRIMDGLLGKLEGVVAYQDNVYIFASSFPQYVWALKLSAYDYVLLHRPGSKMGNADYLSRCPLPCEDAEMEPVGIFLLEARSWSPIGAKDIANATSADPLLKQVTHWVKFGWPQSVPEEAKPYYQKRDELSMMKGCLLRGSCAVVPPALQDIALRLAHSLHFGIAHTKAMARSLIWWPGMSRELEKEVTACEECQKNASAPPKSSSTCWPAAREVWERVHLDYAGPVEGHYLLIGIDAHSKWPVVKVVNNLTAATLITHVRYIFSDFGIPCTIVNDNGAQLVSKEFEQFLLHNNVRHVMSPPWHPASNGLAERAVRSVKELLRKFTEGDFHARLARVLHSMRNRPSSANGVSPAEVMFSNRPSRSPLRRLHPDSWPTLTSTEPPLQPGTLVWALKRVRGSTSWEAGFLKEALGCRVYVVQLNDGSILRVSVDEVRRRLTKEDDESGRPPIPTSEPEGLPTGTELPSRQPVVPPTTPVVTPETPVQEQPKTPPPTTADQEQPRTLDEVVDFIPDQQFLANADKSPEESEDDQHETASVDSHETGTPPPVLSPQGTVLHDSIQGSPSKDTESPRGRGRGRRAPGRPPGSKNVTKTGRQPLVTRSGRISQAPTHWDPWS